MATYTIGEVAERSGLRATALRYYEDIGLVPPAGRTAAGYRIYDDRTLARLAFIARAKRLGCTLDEITDLVGVWDGDRCEPVQRRLHELVTAKLDDADRRIAELADLRGQLRATATQLAGEPVDGPCDDGCACANEPTERADVSPVARPVDVPISCTLHAGDVGERLDEWARLLATTTRRLATDSGGVRLELGDVGDVDVVELARLVGAERSCCAFYRFAITVDERGVGLEVDAPDDAAELVTAMFGSLGDADQASSA